MEAAVVPTAKLTTAAAAIPTSNLDRCILVPRTRRRPSPAPAAQAQATDTFNNASWADLARRPDPTGRFASFAQEEILYSAATVPFAKADRRAVIAAMKTCALRTIAPSQLSRDSISDNSTMRLS